MGSLSWSKRSRKVPRVTMEESSELEAPPPPVYANVQVVRDHLDVLVADADQQLKVERLAVPFQSTSVRDVINVLALKHHVDEAVKYGLFILVDAGGDGGGG